MRGPERKAGLAARDYLRGMVKQFGAEAIIRTYKDSKGKYGRYLADVFLGEEFALVDVAPAMINAGHAKAAKY